MRSHTYLTLRLCPRLASLLSTELPSAIKTSTSFLFALLFSCLSISLLPYFFASCFANCQLLIYSNTWNKCAAMLQRLTLQINWLEIWKSSPSPAKTSPAQLIFTLDKGVCQTSKRRCGNLKWPPHPQTEIQEAAPLTERGNGVNVEG